MDTDKTLTDYGLTEKQAKVFLACLELGSASVQKISGRAGIARSTCYEILESLRRLGFVSTFLKKRGRYYSAEEPNKVIAIARGKVELLERALPQLRAAYGTAKHQPTVRFYQGVRSIRLVLEEILSEATELLSFGSADDLFRVIPDYSEFAKRRAKKKIFAKVIIRDSPKARERQRLGPQELRQVKLLPIPPEYHGMVYIWGNKIAMVSFEQDLTLLVIESPELAKVQRAMFNVIWNALP